MVEEIGDLFLLDVVKEIRELEIHRLSAIVEKVGKMEFHKLSAIDERTKGVSSLGLSAIVDGSSAILPSFVMKLFAWYL